MWALGRGPLPWCRDDTSVCTRTDDGEAPGALALFALACFLSFAILACQIERISGDVMGSMPTEEKTTKLAVAVLRAWGGRGGGWGVASVWPFRHHRGDGGLAGMAAAAVPGS